MKLKIKRNIGLTDQQKQGLRRLHSLPVFSLALVQLPHLRFSCFLQKNYWHFRGCTQNYGWSQK